MNEDELKERTKRFGIETIQLLQSLSMDWLSDVLGRQLLKSATSIGANYRAACRAKSRADFISKMAIVEEEADETLYWLELLAESKKVTPKQIRHLAGEAHEIVAIVVASIKTAKERKT